jgi:superfamily II DNA/RNA helicase
MRIRPTPWETAVGAASTFVVTTGTASGKTLAFNLPVLDALAREPKQRALYLYPTKALAQDQLRRSAVPAARSCAPRSTTATRRPSAAGRCASGRT